MLFFFFFFLSGESKGSQWRFQSTKRKSLGSQELFTVRIISRQFEEMNFYGELTEILRKAAAISLVPRHDEAGKYYPLFNSQFPGKELPT